MPQSSDASHIILDFESDGVSFDSNIIEVGAIITDKDDNVLYCFESMIIDGSTRDVVEEIESNPFLEDMHGRNGLLDDLRRVRDDKLKAMTLDELDEALSSKITELGGKPGKVVLSGSGVSHFDHGVIEHKMPRLASIITYYSRDIGHLRRAFEDATGQSLIDINDDKTHRAYNDVCDHFDEWLAFREFFTTAKELIEELTPEFDDSVNNSPETARSSIALRAKIALAKIKS